MKKMRITKLEKKMGDFQLLVPDLKLELGLTHAFIGGNGSGKSTLAKLIAGLLEEDQGKIDRCGLAARDITLTAQRPYLIRDTVYENIIYPLRIRKISGKDRTKKEKEIDDYLALFNLHEKKNQYSLSLSSGERQKLSLIRALIFDPELLIIDESLSNMDIESSEKMEKIILDRQAGQGKTCILISHQMSCVYRLCQQVHFFSSGRILESASRDQIFHRSTNPLVRKYIDSQKIGVKA